MAIDNGKPPSGSSEAGTCRWLYMMSNHKRICPLLKTEPEVLRQGRDVPWGSLRVRVYPSWSFPWWKFLKKCEGNMGNMWETHGESCSENDLQMMRAASQPPSPFVFVLGWMTLAQSSHFKGRRSGLNPIPFTSQNFKSQEVRRKN